MSKEALKTAGLKATLPRLKVLALFESTTLRHLSAEDIYRLLLEARTDVSLATIYRVLAQFEHAGLLNRHHFEGDHALYERSQGSHHDHLVCLECGRVEEFVDETIEAKQRDIATSFGYDMRDHALNIYGICPKCQKILG